MVSSTRRSFFVSTFSKIGSMQSARKPKRQMERQLTLWQKYRLAGKRVVRFAVIFAFLFTLCAVAQYVFVNRQIRVATETTLEAVAIQIAREIAFSNRWNLTGYRRAEFGGEHYYVLTADGFHVDMGGFVAGLVDRVALINGSISGKPKTVITPVGETWRLLGERVEGGSIVLGILDLDDDLKDLDIADNTLLSEARKFGSTIAQAARVNSRDIDIRIHYAVMADSGELRSATGGIPLRIQTGAILNLSSSFTPVDIDGKSYVLHRKPIMDPAGKLVGQIIIPKNVTAEHEAVRSHVLFNIALGVFCWFVVLLVVGAHFAASEIERRKLDISLEEALRQGEGQTIEFKEGIGAESLPPAISAFANTNSGNIFIGVRDDKEVCGVAATTPQEREQLIQRLRDVVQNRIDPLIIPATKFFDLHDGKKVLRVSVPLGYRRPYLGNGVVWRRVLAAVVPARADDIRTMS